MTKAGTEKTDRNDARGIALVMRMGNYVTAHVKTNEAHHIRLVLTHRKTLMRKAQDLENSLRTTLKVFGAQVTKERGKVIVKQLGRTPDPMVTRLSQIMVRAAAALRDEAKALDAVVARLVKNDPICRRLMTAPGVGPLTALAFKAAVDDPARFSSSRVVGAHFGLTPKRYQSGQTDFSGRISRRGDATMRAALYEAAFTLLVNSKSRCRLRLWGVRMRETKGLKVAIVACARKLAVILHRMWVTERDFDPAGA